MVYKVPQHIWRTADGRLVPTGDPDARFLAYPAGEELADSVAEETGAADVYAEKKPAKKAVSKPADKAVAKPDDKASSGDESKDA